MPKLWRRFDDDCLHCGEEAEVLTDSGEDNVAYDGDKARCSVCGLPGQVVVDEDDWPHAYGYVAWHDELGCTCDWCRTHPE